MPKAQAQYSRSAEFPAFPLPRVNPPQLVSTYRHHLPPKMPSSSVEEGAKDTLRRLSADIRAFRSPEVRDVLLGEGRSPTARTTDELEARVIRLRTSLEASEKELRRTVQELENAKRNAENDREEAETLRMKIVAVEERAREEREAAEERIATLEKEHTSAAKAAAENSILLKDSVERDKHAPQQLERERDTALAAANDAQALANRLRSQFDAIREEARVEKDVLNTQLQSASQRIATLEHQIHVENQALLDASHSTANEISKSKQSESDTLKENVQLKAEMALRVEEIAALRKHCSEATEALFELRSEHRRALARVEEVPLLTERLANLEVVAQNAQNDKHLVAALTNEKKQLFALVSAISPTGSVQDGIKILEEAGKITNTDSGADVIGTARESLQQQQQSEATAKADANRVELARLTALVAEYKQKLTASEQATGIAVAQRDEAQAEGRRNKRLRKIIEGERNYLKSVLAEAESDIAKGTEHGANEAGAVKRYQAAEVTSAQYKAMCDELSANLKSHEEKIRELSSWLAALQMAEGLPADKNGRDLGLSAKLFDAVQESAKTSEKLARASEELTRAREELDAVRRERDALRKEVQRPVKPGADQEEIDYDREVSKVLHYVNNPLDKAHSSLPKAPQSRPAVLEMKMVLGDGDVEMQTDDDSTGTNRTELERVKERLMLLEQQNAELERQSKVGKRTGEIAKRKIAEVRAAVYNMFGWSMRIAGANYSVSSIYAERPDEELEFGVNEKGTMELHKGTYTDRLENEIEQYVHKMNSIPALMAAITMENFEKTTAFSSAL